MWGDVVDLTRRCYVDQVIGLDLDLVARWQEGVEAHYEVRVAFKKLRHSADDPWGVDTLRLELFHYVQKVIVDLRLVAKLQFDLVQVRQSIFHLEPLELLLALRGGLRSSRVAVPRHHRGTVGLDCRAVVVGPPMDCWARGVSMPSTVLGHSGNLVSLGDGVLDACCGLHVVSHGLIHSWGWSRGQDTMLESLRVAREAPLLGRKNRFLILQSPLHYELILVRAERPPLSLLNGKPKFADDASE